MSSPDLLLQSCAVAHFAPSCLVVGDTVSVAAFSPDHVSIGCESHAGAFG
jgi:hypothetical protein